jgi:hypothetical protein
LSSVTAIAVISNIIPVTAKFETGDGVFAGKFPSGRLTENRYQRIELARVGQVNGHVCRRPPGCRFLISLLLAVACLMAWPKRLPGQSRSSNFEVKAGRGDRGAAPLRRILALFQHFFPVPERAASKIVKSRANCAGGMAAAF